jgi:hypothetical protein
MSQWNPSAQLIYALKKKRVTKTGTGYLTDTSIVPNRGPWGLCCISVEELPLALPPAHVPSTQHRISERQWPRSELQWTLCPCIKKTTSVPTGPQAFTISHKRNITVIIQASMGNWVRVTLWWYYYKQERKMPPQGFLSWHSLVESSTTHSSSQATAPPWISLTHSPSVDWMTSSTRKTHEWMLQPQILKSVR